MELVDYSVGQADLRDRIGGRKSAASARGVRLLGRTRWFLGPHRARGHEGPSWRARILRRDLDSMTFRTVIPLVRHLLGN